jgi:hypothetical protein
MGVTSTKILSNLLPMRMPGGMVDAEMKLCKATITATKLINLCMDHTNIDMRT